MTKRQRLIGAHISMELANGDMAVELKTSGRRLAAAVEIVYINLSMW